MSYSIRYSEVQYQVQCELLFVVQVELQCEEVIYRLSYSGSYYVRCRLNYSEIV